ncbi:MAG: hypothetical protein LEGION0403_FIIPPAGN_01647 [Legionella sp.]|uniref:hypothetical protein n=1 Tax=Legionella sp. TaxID=459 RepID=UPI003D142C77
MLAKLSKSAMSSKRAIRLGGNTTIVRFYSNYDWKKHNESSCSLETVLLSDKQLYPDVFQKNSVEFTVLKNAVQTKEELVQLLKGFGCYQHHYGKSIADLMVFETERRSLQITGALIPLLLKTPPKNNDFGQFVRDFHSQYIFRALPDIDMLIQRKKYLDLVYSCVKEGQASSSSSLIVKHFNQCKEILIKRREEKTIDLSDSEINELALSYVADELLKEEMDKKLHDITEGKIDYLIQKGEFESLPLVSAIEANTFIGVPEQPVITYPDRFTVLMAGGPGSGKSISAESMALQLKQTTGYGLDDLALLTVDRKRTIYYDDECVKGTHTKNIGTLTHDEAVLTYNMSGRFLSQRLDSGKKVPNVFKEMCNIWPSWLDVGLKKDGTYIITVSTRKPENAVDGVIARGISNNDFVTPPEYVLNSYRSVSERFPLVVQENQSKKVIINVINTELAIAKKFNNDQELESDNNQPSVVVDCETNTIYVVNLLEYVDFLNQSQLNSKANNAQELHENADISIESSINRVIDPNKFGSSRIVFVRQGINSTAIDHLEENIVAIVQHGELEIYDEVQFELLGSKAPEHFEALEMLTDHKASRSYTNR